MNKKPEQFLQNEIMCAKECIIKTKVDGSDPSATD
jgi:hypothetical protein